MNRKALVVFVICIALAAVIPVTRTAGQAAPAASTGGGNRTAVIDIVRVFNESLQIRDLNERMRRQTGEYSTEAKQRQAALADAQSRLGAFKPGTKEYDNLRKEMIRMNVEFRAWADVTEADLEQQRFEWTRIVYEKTMQAAEQVAKAQGYDVVVQQTTFDASEMPEQSVQALRMAIQRRIVIYRTDEVDITNQVLARMDADYRSAGRPQQTAPSKTGP
ncbi:MAG: OmpH family outer membrane protein [Phycisphaerae bacterium]